MRVKIELVICALTIAVAACSMAKGDGISFKCQGTWNCKTANCYNPVDYSCAVLTAINHPKCVFTGNLQDACTTVQVDCVRRDYYGPSQKFCNLVLTQEAGLVFSS